ncbi:MAG: DUF447 domain-containing protein [Alphaproteobacteria bacterium]
MIYETIVTTVNPAGRVHVAPFGVTLEPDALVIAPYRPSTTLDNLDATGCAVVNLTDDVRVFAGCLTGRRDWETVPARRIKGAVLKDALAHREVEVTGMEDDPERPRFRCRVVHEETHALFPGFNRAQAAVVEAAILVSRLHLLPMEKVETEIAYLENAVRKTAGPREWEAWGWLMDRVSAFKAGRAAAGGVEEVQP